MRPAVPSALRVTANGHRWHRAAPTAGEGAPSQAGVSWPGLKPHPTETFRSHSRGDTVSGRSPFRSGKPECLLPHFYPSAGCPSRSLGRGEGVGIHCLLLSLEQLNFYLFYVTGFPTTSLLRNRVRGLIQTGTSEPGGLRGTVTIHT